MKNISTLPAEFVDDMRSTLGEEEAARLVAALGRDPEVSVRLNPRKWREGDAVAGSSGRVPWCATGHYLAERPPFTFDPLLHAGAYYVQEASSMFVEQIVRQHAHGTMTAALDLCAAPGGKSTLLRSLLPDDTLLVCNEPMAKRAQVLAENMAKWGHENVVVTQSMPDAFTPLTGVFDLVLTDVPCSGEGMFRKDEEAVADWSPANVEMCRSRQRDIVQAVWPALRPGGLLIYSTCTFNRHEDEENVQWIADELGADILPIEVEKEWGIVGEAATMACDAQAVGGNNKKELLKWCHFYPGHVRGEGFFCAALRKHGADEPMVHVTRDKLMRRLRILTHVVAEGVAAHSGPCCEVDYNTAIQYLRGEALRLPPDTPRGIITITYRGLPLGEAKNVGNRANNLYPAAWRIKSTYTKQHSLVDGSLAHKRTIN